MTASATSTFPTTIDAPQAPTQFDNLATPNVEHDLLHDWAQDAIKKIEAKLGINTSPDTTSIDYVLKTHQHQGTDRSAQFAAIPIKMVASQVPNPLEISTSLGVSIFSVNTGGVVATSNRFAQAGGTAITNYMQTNSGQLASTTAINPGIVVFGGDGTNAPYGIDLGHDGTKFGLRLMAGGSGNNIRFGYQASAAPILQSNFTQIAALDMNGQFSTSGNLIYRLGDPSNEVQVGVIGGGAAAGIQMGSASNFVGMTSGSIMSAFVGGSNRMSIDANGLKLAGYNPGTTHSSLMSSASTQIMGTRGFAVNADGATFQGGVTSGISVAVARLDPAVSINNASGDALRTYSGSTLAMSVTSGGSINAVSHDHFFGANAFGGTGSAIHLGSLGDASNAYLTTSGSTANIGLILRSKGSSAIYFQPNNITQWSLDTSGNLISTGNSGGNPTFTGSGVIALHNAGANPFATPVGGGILYASAGALRWRGTSGTDTQIAAA